MIGVLSLWWVRNACEASQSARAKRPPRPNAEQNTTSKTANAANTKTSLGTHFQACWNWGNTLQTSLQLFAHQQDYNFGKVCLLIAE